MNKVKDMIKKNLKYILLILIVIALGIVTNIFTKREKSVLTPIIEVPTGEINSTTKSNPKPKLETSVVDTRAYSELAQVYKDRTLQFGKSCQVLMNKQVYKVGSEILLDNRNDFPILIKIGSTIHSLSAYGYKIVRLSSIGESMIDCNSQQNVATITVQK